MNIEDKVRIGLIAAGSASLILATLGVHVGPLDFHVGPLEARNVINGAGDL
jgi:hypothetical protein